MNAGLLATLLIGGLGIGGTVGYLAGSNQGKSEAVKGIQACAEGGSSQLFMIEGKTYGRDDLGSDFQSKLYNVERESFHKKEGILKEQALRIALAKDKSDLSKLPPLDELLPEPTVSDADMKAFFEENKARLPPNANFEQFKDRIAMFMKQQKKGEGFQEKWHDLEHDGKIKLLVRAPIAPVVSIPVEKYPSMGEASAKNVLVEISDYLCPHCQQIHSSVKQAMKDLGSDIRLVQINFALRPDKLSGSLIEGGFCAAQQGQEQFWKYHNAAFEGKWGSMNDSADAAKAMEVAKTAGIDTGKFETCMGTPAPKEFVKSTNELIASLGVTGTPTFFLNNRRISMPHGGDVTAAIKDSLKQMSTN
ncbi:DsbA family protein [Pseudobacteriovorax antillogorgiicola]|uniref:Protein-disulfide isomerase n=1 Tax=Pseudobacteriovorax antillogorgiicola TaxID=1513793 RepID=A0A1Y6BI88_9BACT|nr:thioredoxin domain-containing protein [Pseudobacteriovorax antillogorgiicola]TCS55404.1 protein-disulfide isomerase [Pseudobacteriovorax antillogorgiicola]SMF12924.1 Protein-disulfide isomerase [Pseudobacteriovorax antillogorgiicola]